MKKYRIKAFDVVNNVWLVQERKLFLLWLTIGAGNKDECENKLKELS